MQRVVLILGMWLAVIVFTAMQLDRHNRRDRPVITAEQQQHFARQITLLREVEGQYQQQHYQAALARLEHQQGLFTDTAIPSQLALAYYLLKGKLHWSLWEYVEAEQAWRQASRFAGTAAQQGMLARLTRDSQRVVSDINRERNDHLVYRASPHVGPAGELQGRIALIYIFVVDAGSGSWSLRDRDYVLATWQTTQAWLDARVRQYGHSAQFSRRSFLVDRNPQIRRLRLGDVTSKFSNVDRIASLVANQLGYPSLLSFTEQIRQQQKADEAMVLLQLARDGRSFAMRCMHRCQSEGEFAVILESPRSKKWQALQYAQAHESLHLFGADDLYNIRGAKYYDVRDIMNYPASVLQASTLEPLTAWAVGLDTRKPAAPFQIKAYH